MLNINGISGEVFSKFFYLMQHHIILQSQTWKYETALT